MNTVIRRLDLRTVDSAQATYHHVVPRAEVDVSAAIESVAPICEDVRTRGDDAVLEYGQKFDGVRAGQLRVPPADIDAALTDLDPAVRAGLKESIARLEATCRAEIEHDVTTEVAAGATVHRRIVAMNRVGLYVPGGLAPLLSTVVMNAVPAQIAGVGQIAVTSPPQSDGRVHPSILAACAMLGIDEVYAAGGAQALAMFAYGTDELGGLCRRVDLITGPGNIYVAAAKRYLQSQVAIDSEAGPTEIAIVADAQADPRFVAADLISQAEHDPLAASVLITDSQELADDVNAQLSQQTPGTRHAERIEAALSGPQSAIVLVRDIDQAIDVANAYGAEHLEIHTADASAHAARIVNAGAVFVGSHTPVSLGDYAAGSNHVLPTGGAALRSSGLSVRAFCRNMQVVTYSPRALEDVAAHVSALAEAENLPAHGAAVDARLKSQE